MQEVLFTCRLRASSPSTVTLSHDALFPPNTLLPSFSTPTTVPNPSGTCPLPRTTLWRRRLSTNTSGLLLTNSLLPITPPITVTIRQDGNSVTVTTTTTVAMVILLPVTTHQPRDLPVTKRTTTLQRVTVLHDIRSTINLPSLRSRTAKSCLQIMPLTFLITWDPDTSNNQMLRMLL